MASHALRGMLTLSILGTLSGCAVVNSQAVGTPTAVKDAHGHLMKDANGDQIYSPAVPDGIPYFLPLRPFIITVMEPNNGGVPSITISPGTAEPDLDHRYVLSQDTNWLADNEFNISVGANGLLKNSTSTATSQVSTAVQNAASSAGSLIPGLGLPSAAANTLMDFKPDDIVTTGSRPQPDSYACPIGGASYQIAVYPERTLQGIQLCSETDSGPYTVTWVRGDHKTGHYGADHPKANTDTPVSGLFFRHELPYRVRVEGPPDRHTVSDTTVTSPDESETNFFPIKTSFFANTTANITVTDGVITSIDQTTKSEVASVTNIPAAWISSVTKAAGQLLSGLSANSTDQQTLIQQMASTSATQAQAAAVAKAQSQFCLTTVNSYNFGAMSAADRTTAMAAIKAACPNS